MMFVSAFSRRIGFIFLGLLSANFTVAVKECLQPVRQTVCDIHCHSADVPKTIPASKVSDAESCENPDVEGDGSSTIDICDHVAQAILVDVPVVDMVLLNRGTCQGRDVLAGIPFTQKDAGTLLPYRNELVILRMKGKHIRLALEHGLNAAKFTTVPGRNAHPTTAGVRYQTERKEKRQSGLSYEKVKIFDMEFLANDCSYQTMEAEEYYTILTNDYLANGGDGYGVLPLRSMTKTPTGLSETEVFWFHVESTCSVQTKWQTKQEVQKKWGPKIVFNVATLANQTMPTNL